MIHILVTGVLVADPQERRSAKGAGFATASIRSGAGDDAMFVSAIAFAETAERLLQLHKGDAVSVAGRAELKLWTGRDGAERTGLSVVATEVAAARPRPRPPRDDAGRRPAAGPASDPRPYDDPLPAWGAS